MTWEELYFTYSDKVYRYIFLLVNDEELAEDLTHDVYIRLQNSLNSFQHKSSYYTWMITIARNIVYDHWRKQRKMRFQMYDHQQAINMNTPDTISEKNENVQELYKAIKKLKNSYQEVIILRNIQELSVKETSEILNWSEAKVRTTNSRALNALRDEILKTGVVKNYV